ncbi:hypothetical protein [Streptococcus suis]|uniref:hypothetical protein n=1 Tax=Streptococcus suis TaxID=1307 RepID=UPI002412D7AD|nr:hypothetical protein [Streptococcus suis]MDG4522299.1 hypothetical protein [Streptococcus suis]
MTKRRQAISPMADIIAKKIFNDHEITIDFINTFLGFRPKSVQILNGTIADVKKERTSHFSTTVDILARMDDGNKSSLRYRLPIKIVLLSVCGLIPANIW